MNKSHLKIASGACIIAILALICVSYLDLGRSDDKYPSINEGLTSLNEFDVAYDETDTYAKGTVFVMKNNGSLRIKIVADIVVGENDTGGITFHFTPELRVGDILCSFNDNVDGRYVTTFHPLSPDAKYNTMVEVARPHLPMPPGGGHGTLMLDAWLSGHTALDNIGSLHFLLAVGGKGNVIGMVLEEVSIPLSRNSFEYETPQPERIELDKSTLTKDLLLGELSDQIDTSEKVIRAFSSDGISDLESSIAIVEKHTSRLSSLQSLKAEVESISKNNIDGLNDAFDEYCRIIEETNAMIP